DGQASGPKTTPHLIAYGELRDLADLAPTGRAALLEAPSPAAAAETLGTTGEILPWRFGGRPAKD
ncbi:MAG: hypothetical protein HOY71_40940, partial [Nonomuraea sp.]|nr:hypothetical protein [Nonomuraea sp.]